MRIHAELEAVAVTRERAALDLALTPLWEPTFLDGSYGFRPGRSPRHLLADLAAIMEAGGLSVLAIDDVRNAFPSVVIAHVMEDLTEHINDVGLLTLLEAVVRGGDRDRDRAVGIAQGDPVSPLLLNVRLHAVHDLPLAGDPDAPPWFRYADNLTYACRGVPEGHRVLDRVRSRLAQAGFTLKGADGPPVDLRMGGTAQLLGMGLSLQDGRLRFQLGADAWPGLEQDLVWAHAAPDPPRMAAAILAGWVEAQGPAFESLPEDEALAGIRPVAAALGFREYPEDTLRRRCRDSLGRWLVLREGARQRHGGTMRVPGVMDDDDDDDVGSVPPATPILGG